MVSEKTGSLRGRITLNCGYDRLACEQRETELRRLYFTYSERGQRDRSFYLHFESSKVASRVKRDFDSYRHDEAKEMVANLLKALTKCAAPTSPKRVEKCSALRLQPGDWSPPDEKSTEPGTARR